MRFRANPRWDHLSPSELRSMQIGKLRTYLRNQVLPFSPHYRRIAEEQGFQPSDIKSHDDLRRIPFTTKKDLLPSAENPEGPREFILQPSAETIRTALPWGQKLGLLWRKLHRGEEALKQQLLAEYNPVKLFFTTGRSADSIPFFLSRYDLDVLRETGRRIADVLNLSPQNDKALSLFPYAPHLAFWQVAFCAESAGILTLNTGGGRVMGGDRILQLIAKMKPTLVSGMPGYFYHVLRKAREEGLQFPFIRKVALGGEMVSPNLKLKIKSILEDMGAQDPKVASVFGFTEARQCWAECTGAENTGFHLSPDLAIFEIIDPDTGVPLGEHETGELVYSTLDGRGSPLLRYRTGDIVEGGISYEPCPGCGRCIPRLSSIIRRSSNVMSLDVSKVKGSYVNFNTLREMLDDHPTIEEWQIVVGKVRNDPFELDQISLHCTLTPNAARESFTEDIQNKVNALAEIHFNAIEFHDLDEMLELVGMETNTKEERIVDRRPDMSVAKTSSRP